MAYRITPHDQPSAFCKAAHHYATFAVAASNSSLTHLITEMILLLLLVCAMIMLSVTLDWGADHGHAELHEDNGSKMHRSRHPALPSSSH